MTTKPLAIFRFEASPTIGGGHAIRSSSLAATLAGEGWRTHCAITDQTVETVPQALEPFEKAIRLTNRTCELDRIAAEIGGRCQALVLDHYGCDGAFERACRRISPCIAVIEDRPEVVHDCDILINQSVETSTSPIAAGAPEKLMGPGYALLRPTFREVRKRGLPRDSAGRLLLICGLVDKPNLTERLFDALDGARGVQAIDVILGAANPHRESVQHRLEGAHTPAQIHFDPLAVAEVMARAALAVTTASSTCWELACLGVPMVTVVAAENQAPVARTVEQSGAGVGVGEIGAALDERLRAHAIDILANEARQLSMASCGRALVDGLGAQRVAGVIARRALSNGRNVA